ncbi:MAG: peptidyl-prolyl cis-trans isomerase SurA [Hydrogenothermaceae bacterium]|nr:peptidyl-prolyl cis-trans isomerase SurA [Hydrogenothermaceae bacterium]
MKKVITKVLTLILLLYDISFAQELQLFDKVVLVVNSEPILKSDIEFAKQWYNVKTDEEAQEKIIDSILLYQQATKSGISASAREVDDAILNIAKANGINSLEEFKRKLAEEGISYEKLKEFIKRDLVANKFLHFYLRQTLSKGVIEGQIQDIKKVWIIFVSKNREDYGQVVSELEKSLNKDNFQSFAKQYSDDKFTAENGGLLGDVRKGDLVKELDEAIFNHKAGDIFKVETEKGTYFIYIEKEDKKLLPKEDFQEKSLEKFKKEYEIYIKKLREQAVIQRL